MLKNEVIKIIECNAKIKNIEDKIPYITLNAKINEVKGKIYSNTNLGATAALNAKINEVKGKIYNITNLATTTTSATAFENEIPNVSNLVRKNWL